MERLESTCANMQELIGGEHGDAVPGADLVTETTADATGQIDGADLK